MQTEKRKKKATRVGGYGKERRNKTKKKYGIDLAIDTVSKSNQFKMTIVRRLNAN